MTQEEINDLLWKMTPQWRKEQIIDGNKDYKECYGTKNYLTIVKRKDKNEPI